MTPDWAEPADAAESRYELSRPYAEAILLADGLPLVLPYSDAPEVLEEYLDALDGLLLTGGAFDIDPAEYGAERQPGCGPVKPSRTRFEKQLLRGALARDLPVLGICGGMQLLDVAFGGSLHQHLPVDVPDALAHEQKGSRRKPSHAVAVRPGTRLASAVGSGTLMVNSSHHQAVHHLGEGLVASAIAADGVIEAVEAAGYRFAVGVQWHPELLFNSVPANLGLYRSFVRACADSGR